jgi:hypothetical protein
MAIPIFIFPVGKEITVVTIDKAEYYGILCGIVNVGGIPALWLQTDSKTANIETILLMQNVCSITSLKTSTKNNLIL